MSKETFDKLLLYYVYNQLFDLHFEIQMTIIKYVIFLKKKTTLQKNNRTNFSEPISFLLVY